MCFLSFIINIFIKKFYVFWTLYKYSNVCCWMYVKIWRSLSWKVTWDIYLCTDNVKKINIKSIRLNTFFIQAKNCLLLHVRFCWVKHIQVLFVFSKFWWIQIECLPIWQFSIIAHSVQRRYWGEIWPQT